MENTMVKGGTLLVGTFKGFKVNEKNVQVGIAVNKETLFGDQEEIKVASFFKDDSTVSMQAAVADQFEKGDTIAMRVDYRATANGNKAYLNINALHIFTPEESADIAELI